MNLRRIVVALVVVLVVLPFAVAIGGAPQIIAIVALVLLAIWAAVAAMIALRDSPNAPPVKRGRRGELVPIGLATILVIWLASAYNSHLSALGTPSSAPYNPVIGLLTTAAVILAVAFVVMALRGVIRRGQRGGTELSFEPWSTIWIARWYREKRIAFLAGSTAALVAVTSLAGLALSAPAYADVATIEKIIDGDTVDVSIDGRRERIRLLNVDTPELQAEGGAECLAAEARDTLEELLPLGATVDLGYDVVRTDKYGRTLAAITRDGMLVNAELAARGLGSPAQYGDNQRYYEQVQDAALRAKTNAAGFYDPSIGCAPAAIVAPLSALLTAAEVTPPTDSAGISGVLASASAAALAIAAAKSALVAMDWLAPDVRAHHDLELSRLEARATRAEAGLTVALDAALAAERAAAEQAAAEQAEAERVAAEQAAANAAAEAARRAAEEAANGEQESGSGTDTQPPPGDGGGSTYTGCRNYNGYGMIDSKGRHFEPIPC